MTIPKWQVNRETWLRGEQENSFLLRADGMMCCLGHRAISCGMTSEQIAGIDSPAQLKNAGAFAPLVRANSDDPSRGPVNTYACNKIMEINDSIYIDDATREAKLKELFAQIGEEVEFV